MQSSKKECSHFYVKINSMLRSEDLNKDMAMRYLLQCQD